MPFRMLNDRGYELSKNQLAQSQLHGPLRDFLRHLAFRDRVEQRFDFTNWGETASFTLAQTQTSTNFTVIDGLGGVVAGTTASVTTANISMVGKTRFAGDNNPMVEIRWKLNTVATTFIVEGGLIDAVGATGASWVTDIDTPSFVGTNGAVFGIWNNQTHTGLAFASVGSFTSQTVASTLLTTGFTTPAADTYCTARILLLTDPDRTGRSMAYLWLNGKLRASHQVANGAVNGQAALYPYFYVQTVAAAVKVPTVDYIWAAQDRVALEAASE